MKKLLISALALASLVACSKEELVVEQTPGTISFDQVYVGKATRAAEDPSTTMATLRAFDAWGFMDQGSGLVFDQQRVTSSDGTTWTYAPLQYWLPNHMYYFSAISPVDDQNVVVEKATGNHLYNGLGTISFTNVNGTTDLLYSATTVNTNGWVVGEAKQKVAFTFNHLLSKVKFSFTNDFLADNYSIVVKDIKMTVPGDGKLNVAVENWWDNTDDWELGTTTTTLEFGHMSYGERIGAQKTAESDYERLTIPAAAAQEYEVTFFVELYSGDVLAYSNALKTKISGAALDMGCAYNFTAKLDETNIAGTALAPIQFEVVKVKEWDETDNVYDGGEIKTEVIGVSTAAELTDAIEAGNTNFRLLADLPISTSLNFNKLVDEPAVKSETKKVPAVYNLDLNGLSIIAESTDAIVVDNGVTLNITGNGYVKAATDNKSSANAVWVKYGNVNIYGGNFYVGADNNLRNDCIYVGAADYVSDAAQKVSTLNIYGGTFEAAVNELGQYWVLNLRDEFYPLSKINVYGGTFVKFNPANNVSEGEGTNFLAEGYISKAEGDNFVVYPANTLQEVATAAELQNALNAGGQNIVLVENITTDKSFIVNEDVTAVLDLNGKNITNTSNSLDVEVGDGIIVYGNLTINGNGTVSAATRAVWARGNAGAVVTINGGYYKGATQDLNEVVYASGNGKVYINNGTFEALTQSTQFAKLQYAALNLHDASGKAENGADIIVKGGKFFRFNPAINVSENPKKDFCAEGYISYAIDKDWYAVTANNPTISQKVVNAEELQYALNAGCQNIVLAASIESANPFIVEKDVVVNLAGYTVSVGVFTESNGTISKGNTDSYGFWVKGGKLTINGNGKVLTGACKYSMAVWANGGNVEINGGYFENAGEGSDLIYAKGESIVTINGGEFKANEKKHNDGTNEKYSALNCNDASYKAKTANFIVKGGKYFGFNPANNTSEGAGTNFVADGYVSVAEGDYFVVKAE